MSNLKHREVSDIDALYHLLSYDYILKYELMLQLLGNVSNKTLLDVGCGTGYILYTMAKQGAKIYGMDLLKRAIVVAKNLVEPTFGSAPFLMADAQSLPFSDNIFDAIICSEVLEHLPNDGQALKEMQRVLKLGGCLILTVPFGKILEERDLRAGHLRRYLRNEIHSKVTKAGFKIEKMILWRFPILVLLYNKFKITRLFSILGQLLTRCKYEKRINYTVEFYRSRYYLAWILPALKLLGKINSFFFSFPYAHYNDIMLKARK